MVSVETLVCRFGVNFAAGNPSELNCCPPLLADADDGDARMVGVGGPDGRGVVVVVVESPRLAAPLGGGQVASGTGAL